VTGGVIKNTTGQIPISVPVLQISDKMFWPALQIPISGPEKK
jgi:hypothetical protein